MKRSERTISILIYAIAVIATLVVLIAIIPSAYSQQSDSGFTVKHCQDTADLLLAANGRDKFASVSIDALLAASQAMAVCGRQVDPNDSRYALMTGTLTSAMGLRAMRYLKAHNLYDNFITEDSEGKNRQ